MLMCLALPGPISYCEFAGSAVILCFLLRTPHLWRTWPIVFLHSMMLAVLAFAGWVAISLTWSDNPRLGVEELGALRWAWIPLVVYPVLNHRRWLIVALITGFLIANAAQAWPGIARMMGADPIWHRAQGRYSGWWHPVIAGSLLTAALGLHLPAALRGHGRTRIIGIVGAGITLMAVLATGSRGAWIASALLLAMAVLMHARTLIHHWRSTGLAGVAIALMIGSVVSIPALRSAVVQRFHAASDDISRAVHERDYTTDTGARILMNAKAIDAFTASPIIGVGAGGYRAWAEADLLLHGHEPGTFFIHDHAHSMPLHLLATTGLVGGAIFLTILILAFRGARWHARRHPDDPYTAGPIYALAGLMLAGLTDAIHINAQTGAMLFMLLALCMSPYPTPRAIRSADPPIDTSRPRRD